MKRLQLPKNKLARLAINIGFVLLWLVFYNLVIWQVGFQIALFLNDNLSASWILILPPFYAWVAQPSLLSLTPFTFCFLYLPIGIATRYIWWGPIKSKRLTNIFLNKRIWGRLKPKPRITRSKDD